MAVFCINPESLIISNQATPPQYNLIWMRPFRYLRENGQIIQGWENCLSFLMMFIALP